MADFIIKVTPEVLMQASTDIAKETGQLKAAFSEMSSLMQRTAGYWTGEAAELHRSLFEKHVPEMEAVILKFQAQAEKLQQISGNYIGANGEAKAKVEELPSDVII